MTGREACFQCSKRKAEIRIQVGYDLCRPKEGRGMNSFAFSVSMPPSSNNMFATVMIKGKPRRIISREYKAWRKAETENLAIHWRRCGSPAFERHLSLTIHLGLNYKGDISNRVKAIEDLITETIPGFPDDRYIDRIAIERVTELDGARVLVMQIGPPTEPVDHPISRSNLFREST